jgi:multisubunit Na+/H+ antiporter MnhE subunit
MTRAFVLTVALAVFWVACVSTVRSHELLVGLGAVLLSVGSCLFVIRTLPLQFCPTLGEIAQIWRLPAYVAVDLIQITLVLILDLAGRRAPSLFRSAPWGPVRNDCRDTAKRVLAVSFTTVSPNCIVVGIDCGRGQMLFHQLKKSPVSAMTRNLGAGAER